MVEKAKPVIIWSNQPSVYFKKAYDQINEGSYTNEETVRKGIMKIVDSLQVHPEKYPPDKFKKSNPGNTALLKNIPIG